MKRNNYSLHVSRFAPLALFTGSALLYMLNLDRFPYGDELYHILAARSLLETGEPRIADGVYERVIAYTWMLSRLFGLLGESLSVARIPSVLAMASVVSLLFIWLRQVAGTRAALIGSGLFAISPFAVDTALFTRFYAVQTLAFFIAAMLVYAAVEGRQSRRVLYLVLAVPPILAAVYFQSTTLIGLAGIGTWLVLRYYIPWLQTASDNKTLLAKRLLIPIAVLGVALAVAVLTGALQPVLDIYNSTSLFSQSKSKEFWYYIIRYQLLYPTLWPAIALITLAAFAHRSKPAMFASFVFIISLTLSSFAAAKGLRYVIYAQPFLFILLGIGLAYILEPVANWLTHIKTRLARKLPLNQRRANSAATLLTSAAIVILVAGNPALARTIALLGDFTVPPDQPRVDWMAAHDQLTPWIDQADVVVTMTELEMLYYYGHYDILFSASRLNEIPEAMDFDPDYRTGKPVIASQDAMALVLRCHPSGIFITNRNRWRNPDFIPAHIADLITAQTGQLELPAKSRVMAFTWKHETTETQPADCQKARSFRRSEAE